MPGTSGLLSPFGKINGFYFNDSKEPDDFAFDFKKDVSRIMKEEGVNYLEITAENKHDYYMILDKLTKANQECMKVWSVSKDPMKIIIEPSDEEEESSEED